MQEKRVVTDEIKTEPPFVPPPPSVVVPSVIGSLQPPSVVVPNAIGIPPPSLMTIPQPGLFVPPPPPAVGQTASRRNLSFNSPQQHNQPLPPSLVMAPSLALPSASATGEPIKLTSSQRKKLKKEAKARQTFTEKMDKILDRQKQKQDEDLAQPISFGAIDPLLAPKDPLDEDSQTEQGGALPAIMGPGRGGDNIQSMALALMDGGGALMAIQKKKEEKEASAEASKKGKDSKHRRRRNNLDPKKIQPKLNSAQALVAATKAGEMSDALKNEVMNSEDATLASQEGLEIRGNDARHLLMAKLMRTNRSCVLVLRNMVRPEDIDEFLEDEIRQECAKYGAVVEVVIAHDASAQIVKIFVKFADPTQVDAAKAALDGRFFGGNTVKAEAYDQILFDHGDYKG
ncbi:unnamed protein product [Caenorhabditis auriculariae]|uniref:RRM domain-containing protein n=1 Tax=Caenorhabditis auriculariae TaxID=2777116 RepID=A0A8S1HDR8_9PELO|nr:unnamed protein product [Caenorhabditis auriculariae]